MNHSTQKLCLAFAWMAVNSAGALAQCPNSQPRQVFQQPMVQRVYQQPVYTQPVYSQSGVAPPVYSQPAARTLTAAEAARMLTRDAKTLFAQGQYQSATRKLDEVVEFAAKDANAYQFRSLSYFASSQFEKAAADAYDSFGLGKAWTRPVIQSLYGAGKFSTYQTQLSVLKRTAMEKPSMPSHFLLAYHHLMNEQWDESRTHFKAVLDFKVDGPLATKLLAAVESKLAESKQVSK